MSDSVARSIESEAFGARPLRAVGRDVTDELRKVTAIGQDARSILVSGMESAQEMTFEDPFSVLHMHKAYEHLRKMVASAIDTLGGVA